MEKVFQVNKWFVGFCAALIVIFAALQIVSTLRLSDLAKKAGSDVFSWSVPELNIQSVAEIKDARIMKRSDNTATIKVTGEQTFSAPDRTSQTRLTTQKSECSAVLTFYRENNNWILGRVELE